MKQAMKQALWGIMAAAVLMAGPVLAAEDGHGADFRTFHRDGTVTMGNIGDSYTADLVMYLAGNQFMVMQELMADFLAKHPEIGTVYVETIPPGQILNSQLLRQGSIEDEETAMNPDLFASVNINHLKKMKAEGKMSEYSIYIHNKLELMVAAGNPKNIQGPEDLGRDDLVQSQPNPITEGIFKFYGSEMLRQMGLYEKVTGGQECKSCWAVPGKTWFTSRHHRETPDRIENGEADVGIVWTTEVVYAIAQGRPLAGVEIPAPLNQQDKVNYAIGPLNTGRNPENAAAFLQYLATDDAQSIYESYGFVRATPEELAIKPL